MLFDPKIPLLQVYPRVISKKHQKSLDKDDYLKLAYNSEKLNQITLCHNWLNRLL